MNREDLIAAGWIRVLGELGGIFWRHPEIRDSHLHTFEEAVVAEENRKKMDGGA